MIVEVWSAERVEKSEQLGGGTAKQRALLSTAGPPVRDARFRLTRADGAVDFGRSMNSVIQLGYNGTDPKVSRTALVLRWNGDRPECWVRQSSGAYVQTWGSGKCWLALEEWVPLRVLPLSFRVDTSLAFYWVLCCPEPGDLPTDSFAAPAAADGDVTDEKRGPRFPDGGEEHRNLTDIKGHLERIYAEFLEWPPHLNPQAHLSADQEVSRKVVKLRGAATNFGFRAERPSNLTDHDFIEWLTESGNLAFDSSRQASTMSGAFPSSPSRKSRAPADPGTPAR